MHEQGERKRAMYLELLATGMKRADILAAVGWQVGTADMHRKRHVQWAQACDLARIEGRKVRQDMAELHPSQLSFAEWTDRYLRMQNLSHHLRIAGELDACRPGETVMVNLWPGAGKSTALLNWVTRTLCVDPNHRVGIVSESSGLSRKFLGRVARRFEDSTRFAAMHAQYGPFYEPKQERSGKPWSQDQFRVIKADHDEADYSMMAFAWNSRGYGARLDTLIVDDVQSQATLGVTESVYDTLSSTWFSRDSFGSAMRIVIVGTRLAPHDIYGKLLDEEMVDRHVILPAVTADGSPSVPEWWTMRSEKTGRTVDEEIARVKKRAGKHWYAQYQQRPRADELSTFASYLEGSLDRERVIARVA